MSPNQYEVKIQNKRNMYDSLSEPEGVNLFISPDLSIHLYRRKTMIWNTNSSAKYICYMDFINNLGIVVFSIHFSEIQAYTIIDEIENFLQLGEFSLPIPIGSNDPVGNYLMICLERIASETPAEEDQVLVSFRQYNKYSEQILTRVQFFCSEEFVTNQFVYMMYFAYLIDIDDGRLLENEELTNQCREAIARDDLRERII